MNNPPSFHFPTWPCGRTPLGLTTKNEGPCCFLVGPPTGSAFPLLHLVGGLPAEYRASYKFYLKSDGRGRKAFFLLTFISWRNPPISGEINQMITNRMIRCRFLGCSFFFLYLIWFLPPPLFNESEAEVKFMHPFSHMKHDGALYLCLGGRIPSFS